MSNRDVFPIINCRDILAAREFYRAVFGGTQNYQFPEEGTPAFLTLKVGTGTIGLGVGTEPAMYGETPLPATGHAIDLCLYVDDLDAVVAAAGQHGGAVPVPPRDMPWGERVAYVRDPEGTLLLVIQGS
ncbi:VOC family protein [Pyxidicoccus xibeiensis]|uniref:VOC family protein n=1 Tax=Pyxidicoccus xibeiensis TaxID=2906759 RepID=UPI0020A833D6|nr:VOC family protein [Pyxidicoccus xibeiensis]MCP3136432.1 VOC family protein [Pyxidicoccus xibeiensis]